MNRKPTRRAFFGQAGAALAVPLAAAPALAAPDAGATDLAARIAALEDAEAVRALQRRYVRLVPQGTPRELEALFNGHATPPPGLLGIAAVGDDVVHVSADGTAVARLPCAVAIAEPIEDGGTLAEMARLQGEGFVVRRERRTLVCSCVKRDGAWLIDRLEIQA